MYLFLLATKGAKHEYNDTYMADNIIENRWGNSDNNSSVIRVRTSVYVSRFQN